MIPRAPENPDRQPARRTLILCDFDGTVSTADTVNRVIRHHVTSPEWRFPVKQYLRGDIGSKGVYEGVAPLMRIDRDEYPAFALRLASLDPGFPRFLEWARRRGIEVKIVSDGFDLTIDSLLKHHGIEGVEVFANRLVIHEDGRVDIQSPYSDPDCGVCGTCKLKVLESFRSSYDRIFLVGDGESDRHAAQHADMVLALRDLFVFCCREGIPCVRIDGFAELPELLSRRIQAVTFDMDGTLLDSLLTIADAFNHMFTQLGYPAMTVDEVARKTCISLVDFVNSFLRPEEAEIGIKIFRDYYDTIILEKTTLMPGAREMLDALDGRVVAGIVTNKRGHYARMLAEHFGFADRMALVLGAQDGFKAKPSGDMFDEFARSTGVDKHAMIYVGDSPIDVEAARNAGIDAFVIANPVFPAQELALCKPRRVLGSLADLPAALEPLVAE